MSTLRLVGIGALVLLGARTVATTPQVVADHRLGVRNAHAMAYDSSQARVLLFGGADATQVLSDLWAWDGHMWAELSRGGPPARTFPALAYDSARSELVLFGGNRVLFGKTGEVDTMLGDTWIWKGGQWHAGEGTGPPARAEASVTYDSHRKRIVLFGGYRRSQTGNIRLGDTWEWDGHAWEQRGVNGPAARNGAAFAYDETRQRAVLFGGSGGASDTWEWDGIGWQHRDAGQVPGRYNAAMTYVADLERIVRFGGWTGTSRAAETWLLGGGTWARLDVDGPVGRNHSAMVYDPKRRTSVLFGGHDGTLVFGDTWEWSGQRWRQAASVAPQRRSNNGH